MEKFDKPGIEIEVSALRQGIRNKYKAYHSIDRDRFPDFEFNTNRSNYEPLRLSFEEEFYKVRGLDRANSTIHIPSTNTLALLFCENGYVPGRKILNTCRSYAEGRSKTTADAAAPTANQPKAVMTTTIRSLLLAGLTFLTLTALVVYVVVAQQRYRPSASGLVVYHPYHNQPIPRLSFAEGRVSNADTVWVVVRAVEGINYWVQPPIRVGDNEMWRGPIYIGSVDKGDIGVRFQARVFVNPVHSLKAEEILHSWPEAELSSEPIEVVRRPDVN